ncbi:hypothetical protein I0E98_13700 [Pseudomonas lalucatii]|nr:hypothetical protein [Pseudomonas lalucatii]
MRLISAREVSSRSRRYKDMSHPRKSRTSRFLGFLAVCGFSAALVACSVAEPAPPLSAEARHLAEQWQALRTKPGHFSGAAWDDQVDKWQGSKHRLMQQLLELAWSQRYDAAQLRALLGTRTESGRRTRMDTPTGCA